MALRLSGQISIFGVVFFVSKSPLGIEKKKKRRLHSALSSDAQSVLQHLKQIIQI